MYRTPLTEHSQCQISVHLQVKGEGIVIKDMQHSALGEKLTALRKGERKVAEKVEKVKSSVETLKNHIGILIQHQESLIEERERKQSSSQWLVKQRGSKTGEDLVQLNQIIRDIKVNYC